MNISMTTLTDEFSKWDLNTSAGRGEGSTKILNFGKNSKNQWNEISIFTNSRTSSLIIGLFF